MAKLKTHKAFSSRVKVTGSGKLLKQTAGKGHFNGRESGKTTRNKRQDQTMSKTHKKAVKTLMPNL